MNYFAKGVLTATTLAALISLPLVARADDKPKYTPQQSVDCDNRAPRVNAVKLKLNGFDTLFNTVDFSGFAFQNNNDIGGFDPIPLLETKIFVGGKKTSCVIAHFSAEANTGDNTVVFQASIDDDPMEGHGFYPEDLRSPQISTPVVIDRSTVFRPTNPIPVPTTASYNFFKIVKPGWHTVKIKWAGCCSSQADSVSAEILGAVLTVEYQGKLNNYEHDDD